MTARSSRAAGWARLLVAVVTIAPLLVFAAIVGVRLGLWDWRFGYSTLAVQWGWWAALAGGVAAVGAAIAGLIDRRGAGVIALVAVVASAGTLYLFHDHRARFADDAPSSDATTNQVDPPRFSGSLAAARTAAGLTQAVPTGAQTSCPGAVSIPRQAEPGHAAYALRQAGFQVLGFGVGRADATKEGLWFGFHHDAVIRIRPGQTDVRIAARERANDGGEACRLLNAVVAELQTGQ